MTGDPPDTPTGRTAFGRRAIRPPPRRLLTQGRPGGNATGGGPRAPPERPSFVTAPSKETPDVSRRGSRGGTARGGRGPHQVQGRRGTPRPSGMIRFLQGNLQHSKSASAVLAQSIAEERAPLVALIQEPWVYQGAIRGLSTKKGSLYSGGSAEESPRACIVASKNLDILPLPQLSSKDAAAVQLRHKIGGKERTVVLASVYLPGNSRELPPSAEMKKIVDYCRQAGISLLIGCDANAHHESWGSKDSNRRGEALFEYLIYSDLDLLNRGEENTYVFGNRQSVIDITVCSPELVDDVKEWNVTPEATLSDHRRISFNLKTDKKEPRLYRNPRRTNWEVYKENLEERMKWAARERAEEYSATEIEESTEKLQRAVMGAYHKACPLSKERNKPTTPWWNAELSRLRKSSRKLLRSALASGSEANWRAYREEHNAYKAEIRRAKRESWKDFCAGVESAPAMARLHKLMKKDATCRIGAFRRSDGTYTSTKEESLGLLLEVHFPGSEPVPMLQDRTPLEAPTEEDWHLAEKVVSRERVCWAIKGFDRYKAPGEDGIFPALLIEGLEKLQAPLCSLFRACIAWGYIPLQWRGVRVVFLPKPGKTSYDLAKSFRPISLMSFLLKTLERLVDRYLRDGPLQDMPLHRSQHAYQAGKSTESALHHLVTEVETALSRRHYALGTFFDIEGAFDNADFQAMTDALRARRTSKTVIRWIDSMLRSRRVRVEMDGTAKEVLVRRGCPQGGVLSPLLWSLVVDSLLVEMEFEGHYCQGYADDGVILSSGLDLAEVSSKMQRALTLLEGWCAHHNLAVNPTKTEMMLFTKRRSWRWFRLPVFYGQQLQLAEQVKFLGVTLDRKLDWRAHVSSKCAKAMTALQMCRRAMGKTWGTTPKCSFWLYTSVIRPMLLYAAVVWWSRTSRATTQRSLSRLQRMGCLLITGAMRSTPTAAMEVLLGLPPLHIVAKAEAMACCQRLEAAGQWRRRTSGHGSVREGLLRVIPSARQESDYQVSKFKFERGYELSIPERDLWDRGGQPNMVGKVCFTDGSKFGNNGNAGCGIYIPELQLEMSVPLGPTATVFQAEVHAIRTCLSIPALLADGTAAITICTDSQAAIRALGRPCTKSKLVSDCREKLDELAARLPVHVIWVPGHYGIEGNERADTLARAASTMGIRNAADRRIPVGVSSQTVKTEMKRWIQAQLADHWTRRTDCRQTKLLVPRYKAEISKVLLDLTRCALRRLVGVITGHCPLNRHLCIMGVLEDPICEECDSGQPETAEHFLTRCTAYADLRQSAFGSRTCDIGNIISLPIRVLERFVTRSLRFQEE